ncbi:MAG TPA: proton-conducting transporter membrane subunit [Stellaceae bacterium]|nr:proton-conducting transporter membrane subunit [Stellaceae bacterium]
MPELLAAIVLLLTGGLGAVALRVRPGLCQIAGQAGAVAGSVLGLGGAVRVLATARPESLAAAWPMPGGSLHLEIDALSAFFLLPVFGLSLAAGIYGRAYLAGRQEKGAAGCWFHLNLLTIGMALVVAAHDGLLFLLAWEVMALSPFFLVIFDDSRPPVRHAAWTYLSATHLGTAFLLVLFVLLGGLAGGSDFDAYAAALRAHPELGSAVFLLALVGFGSKAGIVPAHVWLPEAHPAAPSHASALMSGAMIKVGIYGLVRILTMLGMPALWWGWLLIAIGASSGVLGVLFALAQHDLKRLLAYHSVENIGIILIGIGVGVLGLATGTASLAVIGFGAGLLHVLNHSIFKGLLFLGAGAVQHAAHTLDLEELGGLLKRMKWTGATFLIGAAAIVGLPPLNGFVSEFLLFYAGFVAVLEPGASLAAAGLLSIVVMGLISGLAAACFAKAFGIVFLGSPRRRGAAEANEVARPMLAAMGLLALLCIAIGLAAPAVVAALPPVLAAATGLPQAAVRGSLALTAGPLTAAVALFAAAIAVAGLVWLWRRRSLLRAGTRRGPVWGCGYLFPTARMQYTASSFAQPLTTQFRLFVRNRETWAPPQGYFPQSAAYSSDSGDPFLRLLFVPTFLWFDRMATRLNVIQHGHTHIYVLYVAATLVALLLWASL